MPDDMVEAHMHGVRNALAAGWKVLDRGGPALDAVEEAVVIMEDDETFDAGRGSFLNRDGKVQLDALIMDGARRRDDRYRTRSPPAPSAASPSL
jgi:beta-aspartyl-peptidase (threonine type)